MILKVSTEELETLHKDMQSTYQFKTMNMLQHGESVAKTYEELVAKGDF
jgi:hypothetical protein